MITCTIVLTLLVTLTATETDLRKAVARTRKGDLPTSRVGPALGLRQVMWGILGFAFAASAWALPVVTRLSPARQVLRVGDPLTVTVSGAGAGTVSYQWLRDGFPIAGARDDRFSLSQVTLRDGGCYQALVADATGTRRSDPMFVLIAPTTRSEIVVWGSTFTGLDRIPEGLNDVVAVAMGDGHALALRAGGTVAAWGNSSHEQTFVPAGLRDVVAIAAGGSHSIALRADGSVVAWGNNDAGQVSVPVGLQDVVAIAAGTYSSVAVRANGTAVGWGGFDLSSVPNPLPKEFAGVEKLTNIAAISVGLLHSLVLQGDGRVVALPDPGSRPETRVPSGLSRVVSIAAGWDHSLALRDDGTVVIWGENDDGQLNVPPSLGGITAITTGALNSLVLKSDGKVVAWGYNKNGQSNVSVGLDRIYAVTAGFDSSIALRDGLDLPGTVAPPVVPPPFPAPTAPPPTVGGSVSLNGGAGGAPSGLFVATLSLITLLRLWRRDGIRTFFPPRP